MNPTQLLMDLIPKDDLTNQYIRALNWREPFASLMLRGKIETRTWATDYRGLVLICASQKPYSEGDIIGLSGEVLTQYILGYGLKEQPGMAIGLGELIHCRRMQPQDQQQCYVKYSADQYCHVYANVRPIEPFPWKGRLGWQKVPLEVRNKIKLR